MSIVQCKQSDGNRIDNLKGMQYILNIGNVNMPALTACAHCQSLPVSSSHAMKTREFACTHVPAAAVEETMSDCFTPQK